jgi:hypothetical protein
MWGHSELFLRCSSVHARALPSQALCCKSCFRTFEQRLFLGSCVQFHCFSLRALQNVAHYAHVGSCRMVAVARDFVPGHVRACQAGRSIRRSCSSFN